MQQIAPVFQDFKLFAFSLGENIGFDKTNNKKIAKYTDLVAEYGTHDELINIPSGIYAEMFEAQAKYYREESA